jgi:hypothetical protein
MKLSEIMKSVESNEYLVFDKNVGMAVVFDREMSVEHGESKIKRMFRVLEDGDTVEELPVEKMVNDLSEALLHTIDPKVLIKKVLGEMMPVNLVKAHDIVTKNPEAAKKAKTLHHCLIIQLENPVPGESPVEIPIRY